MADKFVLVDKFSQVQIGNYIILSKLRVMNAIQVASDVTDVLTIYLICHILSEL